MAGSEMCSTRSPSTFTVGIHILWPAQKVQYAFTVYVHSWRASLACDSAFASGGHVYNLVAAHSPRVCLRSRCTYNGSVQDAREHPRSDQKITTPNNTVRVNPRSRHTFKKGIHRSRLSLRALTNASPTMHFHIHDACGNRSSCHTPMPRKQCPRLIRKAQRAGSVSGRTANRRCHPCCRPKVHGAAVYLYVLK